MPLSKGPSSIRKNVTELMKGRVISPARKKGIMTIAKSRNVSHGDARFIQAKGIAMRMARKK